MYSIDRAPFNRSQKIAVVTSDVGVYFKSSD